jgi:hypothetical protein
MLSSLMGCFPLSTMALGFSPLGKGEKMWSDGRVCEWICRAPRGAILLIVRTHWEWWLVGVRYWNTKRQGFLPECEGFFIEQYLWFPNWGFSADFVPRGNCFHVFGSSKGPEFVWKQWSSNLRAGGNHHNTIMEIKILFWLPKIKHP